MGKATVGPMVVVLLVSLVVLLVEQPPNSQDGIPIGDALLFAGLIGGLALAVGAVPVAVAWVGLHVWRVRVGPGGIAGFAYLGWPVRARWDEVEAVAEEDASGVGYLALSLRDRAFRLWIPLDLHDGERFDRLVARYVGPGHPLWDWVAPADAGS